ncbi:MAG: alpha/beta hydrolase [Rhodanobacter sp.]|jgi:pimeloyl-ACP methyl ester carboxylesterase|nr:alpha/beta hydrolase [Rhodanobacter sp.]
MRASFRLAPLLLLLALLMDGCPARGDVTKPIPTVFVTAPQPAHRLVVMLPGRGDDLDSLQRTGIAQLIQQAWPDADVVLTGLTLPYYRQGQAPQRLHDEVIVPARQRHAYRQVWLAGVSLGGMGTLLYDRAYPGQVDGMLLLSPYLGDGAIRREIRNAGGLAQWNPGPPQPMGPTTFQHELWRYLKHLSGNPARTHSMWLAYGDSESFRQPIELMSPLLPPDHVIMMPGHHNWKLWRQAARAMLQRASLDTPGH